MNAAREQIREERIDSEDMRMNGMAFTSSGKKGEAWSLTKYFAREGVDPLSRAFDGKIAVHPGVGGNMVAPSDVEGSLEKLLDVPRRGDSVAYIHVPFCETHCLYCGFYNQGYSREESARYTDTLIRELRLWEKRRAQNEGPVHAVYFGGGTPTALEAEDLERLLKAVRTHLPLANDCEMTVEGRLHNFGPEKMEACFAGGANRFSLGVQSFSEKTLNTLGRAHSLKATMDAIEKIDAAAFENFSIDLIFGSPGQTMDEWEFDIKKAASMPVNHISAYCLEFESGTSCCAGRAAESEYAKREREGDFLETAMELLPSLGFKQYEISNYSKPGGECLHNLSTWNMAEWIGLGPSAASQWRGLRRRNAPSFEEWQKGILNGSPSYEDVVELDDEEMFSSALIFGLRMNAGVDMAEISARFPKADAAKYADTLEFLKAKGLLEFRGSIVRLTKEGRLVADSVAVELL